MPDQTDLVDVSIDLPHSHPAQKFVRLPLECPNNWAILRGSARNIGFLCFPAEFVRIDV